MASKVTPSIPGAPSLLLAISYAARRVSILQTWTYSPQNHQDGSAFALTYSLLLRSCKSMDAFVISSLPSPMLETLQMAGPLRSADITPLHRYYGPGAVRRLVGIIEVGVVSGVFNLESPGVDAPGWRLRHEEAYHAA